MSLAYTVDDVQGAFDEMERAGIAVATAADGQHLTATVELVGFGIELIEGDPASAPSASWRWGDMSPLMQIEVTHHDLDAARGFLATLFGAGDVETVFSEYLMTVTGGRMANKHEGLGDGMLQFVQPRDDAGHWWDQLQEQDPASIN